MGNRAHVIFDAKGEDRPSPAVYLHWNGGAESVYPFLDELDRRGVRADGCYEVARFAQIVGEFFDQDVQSAPGDFGSGGNSIGVLAGPANLEPSSLAPYDHGDNGVYIVTRGKARTVRRFTGAGCDGEPREWEPAEVELERAAAYRDKYSTAEDGIPAFFESRRPTAKPPEQAPALRLVNP